MGDGGGEGVGGVVGLGDVVEVEVEPNHLLHLVFVGGTVAGDSFFDFVGGVFMDGEVVLATDENDDTAGFGDGDAGGDIFAKKQLFDGDDIGLVGFDNFVKGFVHIEESVWQRRVGRSGDDAVVDWVVAIFDDAEATDASSRINT